MCNLKKKFYNIFIENLLQNFNNQHLNINFNFFNVFLFVCNKLILILLYNTFAFKYYSNKIFKH